MNELPLRSPSAGSTKPSASIDTLWNYIQPALDQIFHSFEYSSGEVFVYQSTFHFFPHVLFSVIVQHSKVPRTEVSYHMGIYTATFEYLTLTSPCTQSETNTVDEVVHGGDLYERLDKYYSDFVQEVLLHAPQDDSTLLQQFFFMLLRMTPPYFSTSYCLSPPSPLVLSLSIDFWIFSTHITCDDRRSWAEVGLGVIDRLSLSLFTHERRGR
jgi:hypothetical protein